MTSLETNLVGVYSSFATFSGESPRYDVAMSRAGVGLAVALQHADTSYAHGESRVQSMDSSIVLRRLA